MNRFTPVVALALLFALVSFPNAHAQGSQLVYFTNPENPEAEKIELSAHWFLASHPNGGVVIALHGCGGLYSNKQGEENKLTARHQGMAELLNASGYSVLFVDSFTPRGTKSICTMKFADRKITTNTRKQDVQAAINWLSFQPSVDPNRIALLGWSNGGSTVLNSINSFKRGVEKKTASAQGPKLAVAFYPGCTPYLKLGAAYQLKIPLLILIGEKDDWTPAESCVKWAEAMPTKNLEVRVYPDAYHDFDAPGLRLRHRDDVPNGVNPGQGVTTGGNPQARAAAYQTLITYLTKNL
jgi:dienelactone hydrolase